MRTCDWRLCVGWVFHGSELGRWALRGSVADAYVSVYLRPQSVHMRVPQRAVMAGSASRA
jgi:hypothetical protein